MKPERTVPKRSSRLVKMQMRLASIGAKQELMLLAGNLYALGKETAPIRDHACNDTFFIDQCQNNGKCL